MYVCNHAIEHSNYKSTCKHAFTMDSIDVVPISCLRLNSEAEVSVAVGCGWQPPCAWGPGAGSRSVDVFRCPCPVVVPFVEVCLEVLGRTKLPLSQRKPDDYHQY